jgi:signal transduction histidine kinase
MAAKPVQNLLILVGRTRCCQSHWSAALGARAEAERMNLLVEDLLVLAKFDEEQSLDITTVRVDTLAHDVAALTLPALVDNAVRHTPEGSRIEISQERWRKFP